MLLKAISERLIKSVSVLATNQDRWDMDYIYDLVDSAAAWAKQEKFKKEKNVPEQWTYEYTIPYDLNQQDDDCYTTYPLPPHLTLPYGFDGITMVRGKKGTPMQFYASITTYENTRLHPFFNKSVPAAFVDGDKIKTVNIDLGEIKVKGLFTRIMDDPNFNPFYDELPVTEDLVYLMGTYIINQYLNPASIRPVPEINTQSANNQGQTK